MHHHCPTSKIYFCADPFAPNWDGKISKYRIVDGKTVADQAYYRNAGLDSLALEEGIEEIGEFAFARSSLYAAALPEGVKHIGYGAFYHCDQLAAVTLPETVMCVEPKAFSNTLWMKSFLEGEHTAHMFRNTARRWRTCIGRPEAGDMI